MSLIPTTGAMRAASESLHKMPKVTLPSLLEMKRAGSRISALTAYDYASARIVDEAGIDLILVGDSLAMVVLGHENTLAVTVDEMLHHTRAVRRAVRRALVVADMPFGSYHGTVAEGLANAVRFVTEAGGFRVQGKSASAADELRRQAMQLAEAGAGAVVLEGIPREVAARITAELPVPTIGIGAGPECDGQILVLHDLLGMSFQPRAKFARRYADMTTLMHDAVSHYREDVLGKAFPSDEESYHLPAAELERLNKKDAKLERRRA